MDTQLRTKAAYDFEKHFYKLCITVYMVRLWKMLENTEILD